MLKQSVAAVNNANKIVYYQIKDNAYKYQDRGIPWLRKADKIDSLISIIYASIDSAEVAGSNVSKSHYLQMYSRTIDDINQVLISNSFDPPEWFEFPSSDSVLALDSLDKRIVPMAIKLKLAIVKAELFDLLQLMSPSGSGCEWMPTIYFINEENDGHKIQFDLTSRLFGLLEDRYIEIDSVLMDGKKVKENVEKLEQFTFQRLVLDSLMPGTYTVHGKGIAFSNGNEITESFSHEFKIKGVRSE